MKLIKCHVNPLAFQDEKKPKTTDFFFTQENDQLKSFLATLQLHHEQLQKLLGERNETSQRIQEFEQRWNNQREFDNEASVRLQHKLLNINTNLIDIKNAIGFAEREVEPLKNTANRVPV